MDAIADRIGRGACAIIYGFVPQCQTGQSVAVLGYAMMAVIAGLGTFWSSRQAKLALK